MADTLPTEQEILEYLNNYMRNSVFPGLMRNIFTLVLDGSFTYEVPVPLLRIPIETLESCQHAIYLPPSVMIMDDFGGDVYQTTAVSGQGARAGGIHVAIVKTRHLNDSGGFDPDTTDVNLELQSDFTGLTVAYRVWRVTALS